MCLSEQEDHTFQRKAQLHLIGKGDVFQLVKIRLIFHCAKVGFVGVVRLIELKLLEYRQDPVKYRSLLDHVEQLQDTQRQIMKQRAHELVYLQHCSLVYIIILKLMTDFLLSYDVKHARCYMRCLSYRAAEQRKLPR